MSEIAITGSTGRLGGRVADRLAAAGVAQRLVVRDPSRAPRLDGAAIVTASYADAEAARTALTGTEVALMVSGAESVDRVDQHKRFVDAAVEAGVRHLVYTSFYRASPDSTFTLARDHYATEQHIRASGLAWTFLRDNLYADFFTLMVGDDDVLRGPGGQGRVSAVATDDIADAAVAVLTDPDRHAGATYDLTGPEELSLAEVVDLLRTHTGRGISYLDETLDQAYASRATYGAPDWMVDGWVSTYTAIAAGELSGVSDAVERLTGHRATSLADLLSRS